jgi:hypothetical protein
MIEAEIGEEAQRKKNEIIVEMSEMCLRASLQFLNSLVFSRARPKEIPALSFYTMLLHASEIQIAQGIRT